MKRINWTLATPLPDGSGTQLVFYPSFMDMTKTHFPEGLGLWGACFNGQDLVEAKEESERFFNLMLSELEQVKADELELSPTKTFQHSLPWTTVYADNNNFPGPIWYLQLGPSHMCLDEAGHSHGVRILNMRFPHRQIAEGYALKVDDFMMDMMSQYDRLMSRES